MECSFKIRSHKMCRVSGSTKLALPLLILAQILSTHAWAQSDAVSTVPTLPPRSIDGSTHPEKISDAVAYRLVLLHLSLPAKASKKELARQKVKLTEIQLSDTDRASLENTLRSFRDAYSSMEASFNDALNKGVIDVDLSDTERAIVQRARDRACLELTSEGCKRLDDFVQGEKSHMLVIPMSADMQHDMSAISAGSNRKGDQER
jgi:hypothetical protein